MNKIVLTGTQGQQTATVVPATITDVINPTVPLADASSNMARVAIYFAAAFVLAR